MTNDLLVHFFYANPVGHVVEALRYAAGHRAAAPERPVSVALNATSPIEMARWCSAVADVHAIRHPFLEPGSDPAALADLPRDWGWVCDDFRRHQAIQTETFAGMREYYALSDAHLRAARGRTVVGSPRPGYVPHQPVRLDLPAPARRAARARLDGERPRLALLPAGSSERWLYPSAASWLLVLDALRAAMPDVGVVLLGRSPVGERTATSVTADDRARLLAHASGPLDAADLDLAEQLALVEACDVFCAPHTGFGMAALAVGTPWLALSGGRWFEYFANGVPFRSILPDPERWPVFAQFDPVAVSTDDDGSPRTPSMSGARVREDVDRLVAGAQELVDGRLTAEQSLRDYYPDLLAAHHGDASAIWSIDGVHTGYLDGSLPSPS